MFPLFVAPPLQGGAQGGWFWFVTLARSSSVRQLADTSPCKGEEIGKNF